MTATANIRKDKTTGEQYGQLIYGEIVLEEIIPRHVFRWEDERRDAFFKGVLLRLQQRLRMQLGAMNRHERRVAAWRSNHL